MKVKKLTIKNILSIESAEIVFDNSGLLMISGINYDSDRSNGSGKSAILSALVFGLYGQFPRKVTITDFVRRGTKQSSVILDIDIDGKLYTITRSRPGGFSCLCDDKSILENELLSLIKISYEQYMLVAYFSQGLSERFLFLNDSGRKDLMLKLMHADVFQLAKDKVDIDIKSNDKKILDEVSIIDKTNTKIGVWNDSLYNIDDLISNKNAIEDLISTLDTTILEMNIIEKPDISKYNDAISKLRSKINDINGFKGEIRSLKKQLDDLNRKQEPIDSCDGVCPCCNEQLDIVSNNFVKHDSNSFINKKNDFIINRDAKKLQLKESISELEESIEPEDKYSSTILALTQKIQDMTLEFNSIKDKQKALLSKKSLKTLELDNINSNILKQKSIQSKINEANDELERHNYQLEQLNNTSTSLKSVLSLFTSTGVPAYVLDSIIDLFNQKVQHYVQSVWPQAVYELQSYKESKVGNVTAKMSDTLTIDGVKVPIFSLSGGELRCLSISIDLALLDVVSNYTGASISPLLLDEPFNDLDSSSRSMVIDLLKTMATDRLIIVVDHASEAQSMFDKILVVEKRDGISKIVG